MNDDDLQALSALLEELGLGARLTDPKGHVLWANRRAAAIAAGELRSMLLGDGRRLSIGHAPGELKAPEPAGALDMAQFEAAVQNEWRRARRERTTLGLLMIDVDAFGTLSEQFGKLVAERVVERVDGVVRQAMLRPADKVTRIGREQFAVLLPNTALDGAMGVAEKVRKAVVAADFNAIVPGGYPVTVTIGVAASAPLRGVVAQSLVHGADAALSEARRQGSNRVAMLQ